MVRLLSTPSPSIVVWGAISAMMTWFCKYLYATLWQVYSLKCDELASSQGQDSLRSRISAKGNYCDWWKYWDRFCVCSVFFFLVEDANQILPFSDARLVVRNWTCQNWNRNYFGSAQSLSIRLCEEMPDLDSRWTCSTMGRAGNVRWVQIFGWYRVEFHYRSP